MDQIKLSDRLIDDLQAVLIAEDEHAKDPYVTMQYLAAIMGYLVGKQGINTERKQDVLTDLSAFAKHVMGDIDQTIQKRTQQAGASEAFGIWRPGDS
jgi:hypothetical protein